MKSLVKKRNGRCFRYNYHTGNIECVVKYRGKWTATDWVGADPADWKYGPARDAVIDDFCEMLRDEEFSAQYNVVLENADFGSMYNVVIA